MANWAEQFGGYKVTKPPKNESKASNWAEQFGGYSVNNQSERGIGKSILRQAGRVGRAGVTGIWSC